MEFLVEVVVAVPFPYLALAVSAFKDSAVSICAQNIHEKPSGAYTGEVRYSLAPILI